MRRRDRLAGRRGRRAASRRRCGPSGWSEFIGQARVREQLSLVLRERAAARPAAGPRAAVRAARAGQDHPRHDHRGRARRAAADHQRARPSSGPATSPRSCPRLAEGEVLFIDEIHRMARPAEEMLYLAMEDFRVDVVVGKGPGATAIPLDIAPFTLVGATTRAGLLPGAAARPVRLHRAPGLLRGRRAGAGARTARPACSAWRCADDGGARDRRALARHAPHRQPAAAPGPRLRRGARRRAWSPATSPGRAGALRGRRARGSTGSTGRCSARCCAGSAAGRSGLSTLAVAVGEEPETVEVVAEPFLVRQGLLARTPRGRVATAAAWAHLGLVPPPDAFGASFLVDLGDDPRKSNVGFGRGDVQVDHRTMTTVSKWELPRAPKRDFVAALLNSSPKLRGLAGCVG